MTGKMTRKILFGFFALIGLLIISCEALPFDYSRSQSWFMPQRGTADKAHNAEWATVALAAVRVDRSGGWDSVEKELTALAPLYFWKQGCRVVPAGEKADYTAEIEAREREYISGWRTKRSLALEVRIWKNGSGAAALGVTGDILAAGRIVAAGDRSFSSSDTAGRMLAEAIKQALKKLPRQKKEN